MAKIVGDYVHGRPGMDVFGLPVWSSRRVGLSHVQLHQARGEIISPSILRNHEMENLLPVLYITTYALWLIELTSIISRSITRHAYGMPRKSSRFREYVRLISGTANAISFVVASMTFVCPIRTTFFFLLSFSQPSPVRYSTLIN